MSVQYRVFYVDCGQKINFLNVKTKCVALDSFWGKSSLLVRKFQSILQQEGKVFLKYERTIYPF